MEHHHEAVPDRIGGQDGMTTISEIAGIENVGELRDFLRTLDSRTPVTDAIGEEILITVREDDNGKRLEIS